MKMKHEKVKDEIKTVKRKRVKNLVRNFIFVAGKKEWVRRKKRKIYGK